jgi:methyl-accepting chemotaxis protein
VASEVRSLAQRSSQAAKDIKDLITNSSGQVQEGVALVNRAGASLTEIVDSIKRVVQVVSEIASASAEQSTGIDQVNIALTHMDEVTQQNSALVEENAAAAKALEQQSQGMHERVSFFRVDGEQRRSAPVVAFKRPALIGTARAM